MPPNSFSIPTHGAELRGLSNLATSRSYEGRFGRLFRELQPAAFDEQDLWLLAQTMIQPIIQGRGGGVPANNDNPSLPAGYTYFGQFIDHDITFDPATQLDRWSDPDGLVNFRTPRLDLDSVYGRGPIAQPYLYERPEVAMGKLVLGEPVGTDRNFAGPDLPRAKSTDLAIIADPRNDENKILAQLHTLFMRFHNQTLSEDGDFNAAQRKVRWTYQWLVVNDYLPKIVGQPVVNDILRKQQYLRIGNDGKVAAVEVLNPSFCFYRPRYDSFMPVEFAGAAFRFGHSTVRPSYHINDMVTAVPGKKAPFPILGGGSTTTHLGGLRKLPPNWGIQWKYFFEMNGPDDARFVQASHTVNEFLAAPLGNLPGIPPGPARSLSFRNLKSGVRRGLPSGQDVALAMGLDEIPDDELFQNPALRRAFEGRAPLWYYLLREADLFTKGLHLGPIGGRIVAEVLLGLLWNDRHSYLRSNPGFKPIYSSLAELAASVSGADD